mmetsp:Transcript_38105/g.91495  ORF Transcript_38105/g.91495 Transcript_38105/m.91495 type:complete len:258 (-) Transcript_38105:1403-2176(-)
MIIAVGLLQALQVGCRVCQILFAGCQLCLGLGQLLLPVDNAALVLLDGSKRIGHEFLVISLGGLFVRNHLFVLLLSVFNDLRDHGQDSAGALAGLVLFEFSRSITSSPTSSSVVVRFFRLIHQCGLGRIEFLQAVQNLRQDLHCRAVVRDRFLESLALLHTLLPSFLDANLSLIDLLFQFLDLFFQCLHLCCQSGNFVVQVLMFVGCVLNISLIRVDRLVALILVLLLLLLLALELLLHLVHGLLDLRERVDLSCDG